MRHTELGFTIPEKRSKVYGWESYSKKSNPSDDVLNYIDEKEFIKDTKNPSKSGLKILML